MFKDYASRLLNSATRNVGLAGLGAELKKSVSELNGSLDAPKKKSTLDDINDEFYRIDMANEKKTHVRQLHPTKGMRRISKRRLDVQQKMETITHMWPLIARGAK